jgi:hypothetical protein
MSTTHGLIDEELIENTLHVFNLEVAAGYVVEW